MSLTAPTVTGWQAMWYLTGDRAAYAYLTGQNRYNAAYQVARTFKKRAMADARGALAALIGAAAGGTATVQWSRRAPQIGPDSSTPGVTGVGSMGGNISIETATSINRATTSADVTELKKWFSPTALLEAGLTYPTVEGSGGGGKMRQGNVAF
jgi:hypothetical protein